MNPQRKVSVMLTFVLMSMIDSTISRMAQFAGPYNVIFREVSECDDEGSREFYYNDTSIRKVSRTTFEVKVLFRNEIPLDDSVMLSFNSGLWGNGGWKRNAVTFRLGPICTVVKRIHPGIYNAMTRDSNVTDCPIPIGTRYVTYSADGFEDFAKIQPIFPYGRYKVNCMLTKGGELKGCISHVIDVVPKRDPQPN